MSASRIEALEAAVADLKKDVDALKTTKAAPAAPAKKKKAGK